MGGGDCGYPFQRGEKYVVYARKNTDGTLVTNICSRTTPEDRAEADLAYLRQIPKAGPLAYVYGIAGDGAAPARRDPALGTWQQSGIGGATVTLTGPGRRAQLVTGEDGRVVVAMFTAIYRSQRERGPVRFPLAPEA